MCRCPLPGKLYDVGGCHLHRMIHFQAKQSSLPRFIAESRSQAFWVPPQDESIRYRPVLLAMHHETMPATIPASLGFTSMGLLPPLGGVSWIAEVIL